MNDRMQTTPVLVTGCPRSGSSMVASALHDAGAFFGRSHSMSEHIYQNQTLWRRVWYPYFEDAVKMPEPTYHKSLNIPAGDALARPMPFEIVGQLAKRSVASMWDEGWRGQQWFIESSVLLLTWQAWHAAFPQANWILVRRTPADVARACLGTWYMSAQTTLDGWMEWVAEYEQQYLVLLNAAGVRVREVWPSKFINGDVSEIASVFHWAGVPFHSSHVLPFLNTGWEASRE